MSKDEYIIYGSEYSPFSVKVRSYFRYKGIPHEWRPRTQENYADFKAHAKLPLVPLIIAPDETVMQDSTPILEKMEALNPTPSIYPEDLVSNFMSILIEEYGDEWVNKPMFHYRWWSDIDQIAVAAGLSEGLMPNGSEEERTTLAVQLRERMVPRLSFVGSCGQNKNTIEKSLDQLLELLEQHLVDRFYIFGGKPSLGDFGLFGQVFGCTQQPTTASMIKAHPNVEAWVNRMLDPEDLGVWEKWEHLAPTLMPLIKGQIGLIYMPWAVANSKALMAEEATFTVSLKDENFTQDTMKYTGRSFSALRGKFQKLEERGKLEEILLAADCLKPLISENW